ncbi:MAG: hypothetical protein IBJ03_15675 [Gemmatimonadaceae bacterium]|nr:hypothetical protein [Gemmatimonadaceae bacterium]
MTNDETNDTANKKGAPSALPSTATIRSLVNTELGLPSRLGHVLLLLVAMLATMVFGVLLFTEADLPLRTRVAFVIGIGIGLAWSVFASWVLSRKRVLYLRHHVIAARLAIGVSCVALIGAVVLAQTVHGAPFGQAAVWSAVIMLLIAMAMHRRAKRRISDLESRRAALTIALQQSTTPSDLSA